MYIMYMYGNVVGGAHVFEVGVMYQEQGQGNWLFVM